MKFRVKPGEEIEAWEPVEIEAFRWTGWARPDRGPLWIIEATNEGRVSFEDRGLPACALLIHTLAGVIKAYVGDWVIRGVKGELYPCKHDIFEATYEPVDGRCDGRQDKEADPGDPG